MNLYWDSSFRRAFKRHTRNKPTLQENIFQTLQKLAVDPFQPSLRTHKMSGQLRNFWACWVEYDCRVIFAFTSDPDTGEDIISLIDLGSHEEVY
jgi:mRNA interferase YafQ